MSRVATSDGRVQNRIENYTGFWQKDTGKEQEADNVNRVDNYTEVVNGELLLLFRP
jgi:sterol 24-C-methyltransferase